MSPRRHLRLGTALALTIAVAAAVKADQASIGERLSAVKSQMDEGRPWEALASCRAAFLLSPTDPGVCASLIQVSRAVLWMNPEDLDALHGQVDGLVGLGRCDEAARVSRQTLLQKGDDAEGHAGLGKALMCKGDYSGAAEAFRLALLIDPESNGFRREWVDAAGRAARAAPGDADALYLFASALSQTGQADSAIAICQEAIRVGLHHAEALNLYGSLLAAKGRTLEARSAFGEAAGAAPDFVEPRYGLGNVYREAGQIDKAVSAYRVVVGLEPSFGPAYLNLGNAHRAAGRPEEAIKAYNEAIRVNPGLAEAYNNLGNLYTDQGRFEEAISVYREAIGAKPDFAGSYYNLGVMYVNKGEWDRAEEVFRSGLRAAPDDLRLKDAIQVVEARGVEEERTSRAEDVQREHALKTGKIRLSMASASTRDEAEALLRRARDGGQFDGTDLGFVLPADLDERFFKAVANLGVDELSGVVKTDKGWFVFRRTE